MTTGKRGPGSPFINLEYAIKRVKQFHAKDGFNPARIEIAVSHWGYAPKSSGGIQTIAALKQYGLMKDAGIGKDRKVQLTDLARRIILDTRTESQERDDAIRKAALMPKYFSELWGKCAEHGIPSDENMKHDLVFERNFNQKSANEVVKIFKENIRYAKLDISDNLSDNDADDFLPDNDMNQQPPAFIGDTLISRHHGGLSKQQGMVQVGSSIPVTRVCSMSILANGAVTQEGIAKLIDYLNLIKESFPADKGLSEEKETN